MGYAPRKFRMEIGINLQAATLPRTNPNMRLFPLQHALVEVSEDGKEGPAWITRLRARDQLSFLLVDTTGLFRGHTRELAQPSLGLVEFLFTNPNSGRQENPFEEGITSWEVAELAMPRVSPVYSHPADELLPTRQLYALSREGRRDEWLTLAPFQPGEGPRLVELTVALRLERGGWTDQFIFDPEMIISDIGN